MNINLNDYITGSKYFKWHEALYLPRWHSTHIPTDQETENIIKLASRIEIIRSYINKPFEVNVWIRPDCANTIDPKYCGQDYNKLIGGATHSQHINGCAVDFIIKDMSVDNFMKLAKIKCNEWKLSFENNGTLNNRNWIHADLSPRNNSYCIFNP